MSGTRWLLAAAAAGLAALLAVALGLGRSVPVPDATMLRAPGAQTSTGPLAPRPVLADAAAPVPDGSGRVPAPQDEAGASLPDADWSSLPRSRKDLVRELVARPQAFAAASLWRSAAFNPRDVRLPVASQLAVRAVVAEYAARVRAAADECDACAAREFALAQAHGQAIAMDSTRFRGSSQLARLGPQPFFRFVGDAIFGVPGEHMPTTLRARFDLRRLGAGLVGRLADAFAAAGALADGEVDALRTRAASIAGGTAEAP
jgi:hypothetical protein